MQLNLHEIKKELWKRFLGELPYYRRVMSNPKRRGLFGSDKDMCSDDEIKHIPSTGFLFIKEYRKKY